MYSSVSVKSASSSVYVLDNLVDFCLIICIRFITGAYLGFEIAGANEKI